MKKVKALFLILYAPMFVLLISWILSTHTEFHWLGIFLFIGVVICTEIVMYFKNSKKMIDAASGWIICGVILALLSAEGMCGAYTDIFESMGLILFASTYFFICFPYLKK